MNNKIKKKIFIVAGEASGDLHGSQLIKQIKKMDSSISFFGLGGERMEKEGFRSFVPISKLAVMGFWEVAKNLLFFWRLEKMILTKIKKIKPDKIVLIDYPGFNLRIARKVKKQCNISIIYYISPQLWAWKEQRVHIIKKYIDTMIVVFPFEKEWYKERKIDVQYFGHPVIDISKQYQYQNNVDVGPINIALCPGSRKQEIKKHMPILCNLIKQYPKTVNQKINFIIIRAAGINKNILTHYLQDLNAQITDGPVLKTFQNIHVGVVASGTASLEGSITTKPIIVIYKMSWLSWLITRFFIRVPFASITNILAGEELVPELLQSQLTVENLIKNLNECLEGDNELYFKTKINGIIKQLGDGEAYKKTGEYILNY